MKSSFTSKQALQAIKKGGELELATHQFPSRGQTAKQRLFQTPLGKLFLKEVSSRNHRECQIDTKSGTLAEREFWAYRLALKIGLFMPELVLINQKTTVQSWLHYPDAHIFSTYQGRLELELSNVFECALFDWVTGQIDRHDANYLYNFNEKQIILIDSAHAFLKHGETLPDYLRLFEVGYSKQLNISCQTQVTQNLKNLNEKELKKIIPLGGEEEALALCERFSQIKKIQTINDILQLYRTV